MHMNMEHRASFFSLVYQAMNSLIQFLGVGLGAEEEGFTSHIYRVVKLKTVRLCHPENVFLNAVTPSFYTQAHFLVLGHCVARYSDIKLFPIEDSLHVMSFTYIKKKEDLL